MKQDITKYILFAFLAPTFAFAPKLQHSRTNLVSFLAQQSNGHEESRRSMISNSLGVSVLSFLPIESKAETKVSYPSFLFHTWDVPFLTLF